MMNAEQNIKNIMTDLVEKSSNSPVIGKEPIYNVSDIKNPLTNESDPDEPSYRYDDVLTNLITAVQSYWKEEDFANAEKYADVRVLNNISSYGEIATFMNYLSNKDDSLMDANLIGKWTIEPGLGDSMPIQEQKEIFEPKQQPGTPPPPKPTANKEIEEVVNKEIVEISKSDRPNPWDEYKNYKPSTPIQENNTSEVQPRNRVIFGTALGGGSTRPSFSSILRQLTNKL